MMPARAPLVAAVLVVIALGWPAAHAHACQGPAAWLMALRHAARPSQDGTLPDEALERMFQSAGAPAFLAMPALGAAPLTLRLAFVHRPVPEPATVEIAIDRDGKPEQRPKRGRYNDPAELTLAREGRYEITARVRGIGRRSFVATASVTVLSPAAFQERLEADWIAFVNRLLSGDYGAALECVSVSYHERDEVTMRALAAAIARAGGKPRALSFEQLDDEGAVFKSPAVDAQGQAYDASIRFVPDLDGVWRLAFI